MPMSASTFEVGGVSIEFAEDKTLFWFNLNFFGTFYLFVSVLYLLAVFFRIDWLIDLIPVLL